MEGQKSTFERCLEALVKNEQPFTGEVANFKSVMERGYALLKPAEIQMGERRYGVPSEEFTVEQKAYLVRDIYQKKLCGRWQAETVRSLKHPIRERKLRD